MSILSAFFIIYLGAGLFFTIQTLHYDYLRFGVYSHFSWIAFWPLSLVSILKKRRKISFYQNKPRSYKRNDEDLIKFRRHRKVS